MVITGDELYAFYAHLGQALYMAQVVEGSLHKILAMKIEFSARRPTAAEAAEILERYRARPLGGLITIAERNAALPADLIDALRDFNDRRRFVVHRLQEEAEERLRNDGAYRRDLIARLALIADRGGEINTALIGHLVATTPMDGGRAAVFSQELAGRLRRQGFAVG